MNMHHRGAVFLDRDGTLSEEVGYMRELSMFRLFPWTSRAIRKLNESGLAVVVVTNQSGIGRGFFDETLVGQVHDQLRKEIHREGAHIDAIYFCPHHPDDDCDCRKPRAGLLERAGEELQLDFRRSFMVGDTYTDIRAGAAVGAQTILVLTGYGSQEHATHGRATIQPDHVALTLEDAIDIIVGSSNE